MKYTKPIWYFHLKPFSPQDIYWIPFNELSNYEKKHVLYDDEYSDQILSDFDCAFQLLLKGCIRTTPNDIFYKNVNVLPADIYRFIRKYYNKSWIYLIFIWRILLFNNPFMELQAILHTRSIRRSSIFESYFEYDDYDSFIPNVIKAKEKVSIIIPTYNRYNLLKKLLKDLEEQEYSNFEVIIIDQSNPFQDFYYKHLDYRFRVIRQDDPLLWKARNEGVKLSKTNFLLFLDDDSIINSKWIIEHLKCLEYFDIDISAGVSKSIIGAKVPLNYNYFRYSDQIDTGNVLIKKQVFKKCGLFDRQFEKMRLGDGEFGARSYLYGFKNIYNPRAYREHIKASSGGLRAFGHWDAFRTRHFFSPKPVPSVLYFYRKYWGDPAAIYALLISIPLTYSPYKLKTNKSGYLLSMIIFILFFPIVFIQVLLSWKISNKMLSKGAMIEEL